MNLMILSCLLLFAQDSAKQGKGQPPGNAAAQAQGKYLNYSVDLYQAVPPLTLEQAINQALSNHPDIRLAEAEMRVAEARLAQARSQVSQKVAEEFQQLEKAKIEVERSTANWERMTKLLSSSAISQSEYKEVQAQLANAKAKLATSEQKWNMMMGKATTTAADDNARLLAQHFGQVNANQARMLTREFFNIVEPETVHVKYSVVLGSITDQLKNSLETKIKLEQQTNIELEKALKLIMEGAGVRNKIKLPPGEETRLSLDAAEYPLHAWLQLVTDELNSRQGSLRTGQIKQYNLYVREYGLLMADREHCPSDAITVQELLKQVRQEKTAKDAKKPESTAPRK